MTFHAYCRARRMGQALQELRVGSKLDDVVFDSGYESHSGFRGAFARTFGAPPGRARGAESIAVTLVESPLGPLVVGATSEALCLVEFATRRALAGQVDVLQRRFRCTVVPGQNATIERARRELDEYFAGTRRVFETPTVAPGTAFQESVWAALCAIPYGETRSYEAIARSVGRPGAVRAVGTANGANRLAIVIPCHRVVNKSGALGGYGGGLWRKQALLDWERARAT
jgi:AraC family transcriptional regulator of adaptative response/methylated-DNA-[protein]-cysteine methyltransferase